MWKISTDKVDNSVDGRGIVIKVIDYLTIFWHAYFLIHAFSFFIHINLCTKM